MFNRLVAVSLLLTALVGSTAVANYGLYHEPYTGVWRCQYLAVETLREQTEALLNDPSTDCRHGPVNDFLFNWLYTSNPLRISEETEQLLVIYSYNEALVRDFVALGRELMTHDPSKPNAQLIQPVFSPRLLNAFDDYVREELAREH